MQPRLLFLPFAKDYTTLNNNLTHTRILLTDIIVDAIKKRLTFEPTADQEHAIVAIARLVTSEKFCPTLIVNGFAGTGKTSLMRATCDGLQMCGMEMVLMAPTGRAAKVLANTTGRKVQTIHRTIFRQHSSTDSQNFDIGYNNHTHTLFIVDEGSLIGNDMSINNNGPSWGEGRLLSDLIRYVFSADDNRLIIIGDPDQLPPIGQIEAPALSPDYLRDLGLTVGRCWLREVVRQQNEGLIVRNATAIRQEIDSIEGRLPILKGAECGEVEIISGENLMEKIEGAYNTYGTSNTMVVTRSNKQATRISMALRTQVMYVEEVPHKVVVDEAVVVSGFVVEKCALAYSKVSSATTSPFLIAMFPSAA